MMDPRDQEKAFERLLARALRESLQSGGPDCPEPDILAAYMDRSLGSSEVSRWELHFSRCARCQHVLAALGTGSALLAGEKRVEAEQPELGVAAAAAALPAAARAAAPAPLRGPQQTIRPPRRSLTWRWLAPAAGIAAVVALWIAVRPSLRKPAPSPPTSSIEAPKEVAQNKLPPAQEFETPSDKRAEKKPDLYSRLPAINLDEARTRSQSAGSKPAARAPQTVAPSRELEKTGKEPAPPVIADRKERADEQAATLQKEADKTIAAEAKPKEPALAGEIQGKTAAGGIVQGRPGPAAPAQPPALVAGKQLAKEPVSASGRALMTHRLSARPPVVITSPNPAVMWRLGPAGIIEHSRDAGRTWQLQTSGVLADLVAGAAPSETVCWAVGRAGTILRTTDGKQWERVSSPAPADWIAIQALDALNASVLSANQERYLTRDGGKNWRGPFHK